MIDLICDGRISLKEDRKFEREEFPDFLDCLEDEEELDLDTELAKPIDFNEKSSM